jgi:hypothetical protein
LAGFLLLPYLAWVTFAGVLNFSIARLNPGGAPVTPAAPMVGVAAADCAPWDGAATSIYLSSSADPSAPPELQLVVYLGGEGLPGRRVELGRQEAGSGIALRCDSPSSCTTSSAGVIEFALSAEAGVLAGAYRVEFDERAVAGTFRATWSRRVALCG